MSGSFAFQEEDDGMVEANQFMMRLHLQKVPQPPLGRGGPCEASPLYSCCPPLQKFRYLYLCLYLHQNLRLYPNLHIRLGLHLTLLDIQFFFGNYLMQSMRSSLSRLWTWACMIKWYRDIHLFASTVNQQCQNAASGTRRKLRGITSNTHDEG